MIETLIASAITIIILIAFALISTTKKKNKKAKSRRNYLLKKYPNTFKNRDSSDEEKN